MISESTINKVRNLSIEDILKPYVRLSRKGLTLMGLCPFHSERTGSFAVTPRKNLFHCFSCNRGGDGITFIMEKENLTFMEAVTFIAKNNGIPIEFSDEERSEEELAEAKHKESLLIALDHIQRFFVENLRVAMTEENQAAREYAYGRWSEEFCSIAGIGFAPKDGNTFMEYCRTKGLNEESLFELGMLKRKEDGSIYAMFRQRIMIPIRNRWGRIIAYTARYIGNNEKAPKYINSSTSIIYSKGETLFGIDRASRQRDADYYIIVEGAPDVLRMQSVGFDNTVATLGTAWTDSQFEQLKKFTASLCFIPDSDTAEGKPYGAGFEAVMTNGASAIKKGFHVTVRELPFAEQNGKNDADSYIHCKEDYSSLKEKHFIVWLAQKRFCIAGSLMEERKYVAEIADLLRYVKDQLVFDQCIEQLGKLHGKVKLWRDAVTQARGEARKKQGHGSSMNEMQREAELLRQFGLFVRENCYYAIGEEDEEPARISNFIMEPLFHIEDENNATRIFRMRNMYDVCRVIELKESELCSLSNFQQKAGSLGNYVWLAKIDKLNRVKEYLYSKTDTAERIRKLGWNASEEFFAFGNGILYDGTFKNVDDLGIDPPNLGVTSVPAMNDRVSQAVNTLVVLDEYKNDLDIRKIAYLKGLWGGGGQTKKNTNTDGMAAQTIVSTGVALCGQDKPTQDMALYTRVIFLAFSKTSFNQVEKRNYEDLVALCNMGLTHLTIEILNHRELFEKNFAEVYSITKRELAAKFENESIHDRIFGNWVIPLAAYRTLETVLDVPFSYADLFETAVKGIRSQNELAQESSEVADFWSMLQGFQTSGKCVDKAHYRIRYMKSFRPISVKEDIEFKEARPILYLNMAAVASLFNSRNMNATANRSNWSTIMSYLKSHSSFLGLKQDRFTILLPSGLPDYSFEIVNNEQVKKVKVNRPKALCFDYLQLKEAFGLELETEVITDTQDSEDI